MNYPTHTIGDATSVQQRYGSENLQIRPEKLLDVLVFNNTGSLGDGNSLYCQVHEIAAGAAAAPADGSVPRFSFPVFSLTGGTLGRCVDLEGIYVCWSTTQATKTLVAANSGSIAIVIKG